MATSSTFPAAKTRAEEEFFFLSIFFLSAFRTQLRMAGLPTFASFVNADLVFRETLPQCAGIDAPKRRRNARVSRAVRSSHSFYTAQYLGLERRR